MTRFLMTLGLVILLAGCGSAVKLDEVPVVDKSGTAVSPLGTDASASGTGSAVAKGGVTPVNLGKTGPAAVAPLAQRVIYFDYDSFVIKPEFQAVIESQARYILADSKRKVAVEGHTDERGGREYNLALGQKRAEAVRRALGLLGVSDGQVEAVSFGKEKPAVPGSDEASMAKNRRAEISYR
jgi:peptidoglycan-associated lipoprotein